MRIFLIVVLILALAIAAWLGSTLAGCTPNVGKTAPGPDASTAAATCANLARLGCPAGGDALCASRVELAVSENRTTSAAVDCARRASSTSALAACGPFFACAP